MYVKSQLACTDYNGAITIYDTATGQAVTVRCLPSVCCDVFHLMLIAGGGDASVAGGAREARVECGLLPHGPHSARVRVGRLQGCVVCGGCVCGCDFPDVAGRQ
jgi:hypothetical protein